MTDVRRLCMDPWTFTVNWFVTWRNEPWEQKCVYALFVGM